MKRLLFLLVFVALSGCALLRTDVLKARDITGLPSLQEVLPRVYVGDWGDAQRISTLKKHGVKYVFNVAWEIHDPYDYVKYGIVGYKAGLVDYEDSQNVPNVLAVMDRADQCYNAHDGNLMWHCEGGRNRTLLAVAMWWARRTGQSIWVVIAQIQKVRPEMALHPWEVKFIKDNQWMLKIGVYK